MQSMDSSWPALRSCDGPVLRSRDLTAGGHLVAWATYRVTNGKGTLRSIRDWQVATI